VGLTQNNPGLTQLDELCVQTIRFLSVDAIQKAGSGHPGMPMGMAPAAYVLWAKYLKHNPANPTWLNRDRFVLSAGHGSVLLYSLLYLAGYDITLDDIKNFRQLDSKTPGHPEYNPAHGIEVTTGPLGQGLANAVGMAIEQKHLAARFNRQGLPLVDYNIYSIAGDGCLQEGITSEASSLAGHLGLDNLIVIYDDNHISIDGDTGLSFTEKVEERYRAYGWNVEEVPGDGNDMQAFEKALNNAKKHTGQPSLIKLRTHIAYGSPNKQDTAGAHGAPLGEDEIRLMKKQFGWDPKKTFHVPEQALKSMRQQAENGARAQAEWQKLFETYEEKFPQPAKQLKQWSERRITVNIDDLLPAFKAGESVATRKASGKVLDTLMPHLPFVVGGSADLTPSNKTRFEDASDFQKDNPSGRYFRFGVREHAMGGVINGIAAGRILRPYGGTFLVFSDYMRAAVRVAAMSRYPSIFVFTHDSIGVGEDGPTHQPVEHIASLRAMPNLLVMRPADANETAQAWKFILNYKDGPVALLLSRQGLTVLDQNKYTCADNLEKGAYALIKQQNPDVLLLASGSEVGVVLQAAEQLEKQNITAQVVSMPCWKLFEMQDTEYKNTVLPPAVKARVAIEAAVELGWHKYLGAGGIFIGLSCFGASAPAKQCLTKFNITAENVVEAAKKSITVAKTS